MKSFAALAVVALLSLPGAAQAQIGPSELLSDLNAALRGQATQYNWKNHLDVDFSNWRVGGSENLPVIAAAIALIKEPIGTDSAGTPYNMYNWWDTFFDCQNNNACNLVNPGSLKYFKGSEVFANTYDYSVTTSVATVHFRSAQIGDTNLLNHARAYLRKTWSLYSLVAGNGPARWLRDDVSPFVHDCQVNAQGAFFYNGPYIALAGARSGPAYYCQDHRGPLLARATAWPMTTNLREEANQANVLSYIQANWPGNIYSENVYALDSASRTLLRDHINNGNQASTLLSVINNGNTRFIRTFRLLAWPGVRVSVMEGNPNRNTWALYAVKYTASTQEAHVLFPWNSGTRNGITEGYGKLLPDVFFPNTVEASNLADWETANGFHGDRTVSMPIPTSGRLYHVVIGDFVGYLQ